MLRANQSWRLRVSLRVRGFGSSSMTRKSEPPPPASRCRPSAAARRPKARPVRVRCSSTAACRGSYCVGAGGTRGMDEINNLKDWINNPPISRGAAAFVVAFSLEDFSRNREGLDFLKAFADRTEAFAKGRGCDFIRISISSSVLTVCDQEMIVSGVVSEIKLILLRMIGRLLPDY